MLEYLPALREAEVRNIERANRIGSLIEEERSSLQQDGGDRGQDGADGSQEMMKAVAQFCATP